VAFGHCCSMNIIVTDYHSRLSSDNVTKPAVGVGVSALTRYTRSH